MKELIKTLDKVIVYLNNVRSNLKEPIRIDVIIYKGIKISLDECYDRGKYWMIPRRIINKFNKEGHDLIPKEKCITFDKYIKELEYYRDTTQGLYATDRRDLVHDLKKVLFKLV